MTRLSAFILAAVLAMLSQPAVAHPHDDDRLTALQEKSRELADKARVSGEALIDSDMVGSLSDMLSGLADRVEIQNGEGTGTALWIDGGEVIRFNAQARADDALHITGLGTNLSVERETVIKDGITRTRIVIEMDGGEDVNIALPGTPTPDVSPLNEE